MRLARPSRQLFCFNYFFLPPVGTLTIADTRNWVALFAFLGTAMYASHLASRIREESEEANARRRESEMLYRLAASCSSRRASTQLFNYIPSSVASAFNSPAVTLYIAEGDRIYLSDPKRISSPQSPGGRTSPATPSHIPIALRDDRDLREAMMLPMFRPARGRSSHRHPAAHRRASQRRASARGYGTLARDHGSAQRPHLHVDRTRRGARNWRPRRAAKETERLRTALLDSVTHELRTPLTSIKASITALLSQPALDAIAQQRAAHRHRRRVRPPQPPHRAGRRDGATRCQQSASGAAATACRQRSSMTAVAQWRMTNPAREFAPRVFVHVARSPRRRGMD